MKHYTIEDVQRDWRCLDAEDFAVSEGVRLISHEEFTYRPGFPKVEYIPPGGLASFFRFFVIVFNLLYAWRLLRHTKRDTVLIVSGSGALWLFIGLLNRYVMLRKRNVLLWDVFVEVKDGWRRTIMSAAMASFRLNVLWSRKQIEPHAEWLRLPKERFIFLPYKANHSKGPAYDIPIGNFIFSGGNGKRDYKTLVDAVRDTGIPVVISATDPAVLKTIERLPSVIALAAREPAFAQLQAAARFVVVPMIDTGLKGGGEANFCNAQWHGRPVVAADRMAAEEYIVEGETGYIVPPGDSAMLRQRILELWNDPAKCAEMGRKAKAYVDDNFTHEAFIRRLLRLATLIGSE
ncbi:MAG: glycosyltransferase family 4 protein [Pirellulaceae bacterium]|nr:glycosyltransferase family 4 protein [Pirellulaceae bacterium]